MTVIASPSEHPNEGLSEAHGEVWPSPCPTVWDLLVEAADRNPEKTALVCLHQKHDHLGSVTRSSQASGCLRWTFSELMRTSHALAQSLAAAGIQSGMRIVACLSNCAEFHVIFRAALELNCTFVPTNPKSAGNIADVNNIFDIVKPSVLIAQDSKTAEVIARCNPEFVDQLKLRLIVTADDSESHSLQSWQSFEPFITKATSERHVSSAIPTAERKEDDVILVLMTSGTTSLPKGCPHTNISLGSLIRAQRKLNHADESRILCQHLPVSHVFGLHFPLSFFIQGLTVVQPSLYFDAGSTLRAIREEKCTDWGGVPAMAAAVLHHPDLSKSDTTSMKWVILGATTSTPATVRQLMEGLECGVSDGYGMSEGAPVALTAMRDAPSQAPSRINSGNVCPGAKARVCDPETNKILPRGQAGELHAGGTTVIREYWINSSEEKDDDSFYVDDAGHWLKTGDQAIMDGEGNIEIVGRYKHLIIRGGENLSPKAIEEVLLKRFNLQSDVVGIPDDSAGEVPVAVIKPKSDQRVDHAEVKKALVSELGAAFAVEYIIDLSALGLEDFPKTLSGKVQKNVLQEKLAEYFEQESQQNGELPGVDGSESSEELETTLTRIWGEMLGVGDLTPESNVKDWADSLTLSRFPGVLRRKTGQSITLQDLLEADTIKAQSQLLSSRNGASPQSKSLEIFPERDGPPEKGDMIHAHNDEQRFTRTRELCEEALKKFGMDWQHVKDITPLYSFQEHFLERRRPQSNNHRHAFVCGGNSVSDCRAAVVSAMSRHAMLCTLAINFDNTTPLHVMVRPVSQWFDSCITEVAPINTASDLEHLVFNDPELDHAAAPGPLFRIVLTHIRDENCAGMVYMAQHSVFDGISLPFFLEDLDPLLQDKNAPSTLTPRVPFKPWADSEYSLRSSLAPNLSIKWHATRLRGLSSLHSSLFPPKRSPEWFKGDSSGWVDLSTGAPGPVRKALDPSSNGVKGLVGECSLPSLARLKREFAIEVPTVLKAALALLNLRRTGARTALFAQYQAARTWAFLPDWQAAALPPAMEVDGPTVQALVLAITPERDGSVREFMAGLQRGQEGLTGHQHAPFEGVVRALNEDGSGDGDVMVEVWRRQIFNWLPRATDEGFRRLRRVQQISRTDVGILWNCMQLEGGRVRVMPSWDDAQLTPDEVEGMLKEVLELAEMLASEGSWEKKVGELL